VLLDKTKFLGALEELFVMEEMVENSDLPSGLKSILNAKITYVLENLHPYGELHESR
jgi:hypothetical protein